MKLAHLIRALLLTLIHLNSAIAAEPEDNSHVKEHVFGGLPSNDDLFIRNAYIMDYDAAHKAPRWVAYHLTREYRRIPKRTGIAF